MSSPCSMTTAPSLTATSPSPPKLVDFQPASVLPSKSDFQFCASLVVVLFLASPPGCATLNHVKNVRANAVLTRNALFVMIYPRHQSVRETAERAFMTPVCRHVCHKRAGGKLA